MKYTNLTLVQLNAIMAGYVTAKTEAPAELTAAIEAKKKKSAAPEEERNTDDEEEEMDEEDKPTAGSSSPGDFARIAALVPEGQHFTQEAFSNEGIWITGGHLVAVENALRAQGHTIKVVNKKMTLVAAGLAQTETQLQAATAIVTSLKEENVKLKARDGAITATPPPGGPEKVAKVDVEEVDLAKAETKWDVELKAQAKLYKKTDD